MYIKIICTDADYKKGHLYIFKAMVLNFVLGGGDLTR